MAERPQIPPPRKPVSTYPTPTPAVVFFTELVNRDDPAYKANGAVKRGSLYSSMVGAKQDVIGQYPDLYFLRERQAGTSDQLVFWDWSTEYLAEDAYNAEVNYVANSITYPAFNRVYTIRRDVYDSSPTLPIGSPLTALIGVKITSSGSGYTQASGAIDGTDVDIEFVCAAGQLISAVIKNEGLGVTPTSIIQIIGDGLDGVAVPITQSVSCVLTSQKKQELAADDPLKNEFVRIIRTYETLPSPFIESIRIDKDGAFVTAKTRRQVADFITDKDEILNSEWVQTSHKGVDDFIAEETVESRPLPGNPIVTTRVDEDGMVITITKTLVDATTVISAETLVAGIWTRTRKEELSSTSFVKDTTATNLVCWQVSEARPIPGNPIPSTDLDKDGMEIDVVRTMKAATAITTSDTIVGTTWIRTNADQITDLVSWEVVKARTIPGNIIPSANIDQDHETATITTRLKRSSTITPGASEAGGIITTTEEKEVSDLVSEEVVTTKRFLDAAFYSISIENLIPREFRAFIPTYVESHILAGTASFPTLGVGEFEHSRKQLTKLLYEDRITSLGSISLPITHTNQETTEEYGGGILNANITLDTTGSQAIDEGYLVVESSLVDLGNGMEIKQSKILDGTEWPELSSSLWDDNMRLQYTETTQVVPFGSSPDPDPGVFAWISEVKKLDVWRSLLINSSKPSVPYNDSTTALISYAYKPYRFPGLLYFSGTGYYVRAADATLVQHQIRTWWEKTATTPTPTVDDIILDDVVINNLSLSGLTYSGPVLHDALTVGVLSYPATTPSYTDYALGTLDGTFTLNNIASLYSPGSTGGYLVGDTITILSGAFTMSVDVTFVYDVPSGPSGLIGATTAIDLAGTYPPGTYGPIAGSGGTGTGAFFNVWSVNVPNYTPGTAWIGTYRVVGASVTPEREKDVWKVSTESVIMR